MKRARRALLLTVLLTPLPWTWAGTAARVAVGGAGGLVAGTAVTLGVVVARARLGHRYLESTRDLLGPPALPIPVGAVAGIAAGAAGGPALVVATATTVTGGLVGAGAGWLLGALTSAAPEDAWAGGVMGGAAGVVLGVLLGVFLARGRRERRPSRALLLALWTAAGVLASCAAPDPGPDPSAARVVAVAENESPAESVIFLVGDPGKARYGTHPVLRRLSRDVERWSGRIPADSSVVVLMLGDIVYPEGMHAPGTPERSRDSARVADQLRVVTSDGALRRGARMLFLAGNHDWGLKEEREGARRLKNLGDFLDRARARGLAVRLAPEAGTGGPAVVDVAGHLRLILLDTAWWIFDAENGGSEAVAERVAGAVAGAGDRHVVVAAHHPFRSGGPHGGLVSFWRTVGIHYLLNRSGALLQDLGSRPYRDLRGALGEAFRRAGRPLAFVGGHEHSLQLIRHDAATQPRFSLVSGSASKVTDVGPVAGTMLYASEPGYMRLVVRENGAVDLFVVAAPARYLSCPDDAPAAAVGRCMANGAEAYRTIFSTRLSAPS